MTCYRRRTRIVQIHPARRCNLTCRHCYTESGPRVKEELPLQLVLDCLRDSAAEGYGYVSISGGEPLMWPGLASTIDAARDAGMAVTLTTNATMVTPRIARELATRVTYLAVSVDGPRASHDRLRGEGTFDRMHRGIRLLRDAGVKLGIIWTLTQSNAQELAIVHAFAAEVGAAFLQVHPLEGTGYAATLLRDEVPELDELVVAGLFASELADGSTSSVPIHLDAALTTTLAAQVMPDPDPLASLSALVDPLVVRADGLVVPGNFAIPAYWAIGSLYDDRLPVLLARWRRDGLSRWRALVVDTLAHMPSEPCLVNFGHRVLTTASSQAVPVSFSA